ncbi:MAG: hypothetical protein MJ064_01105 [Lachnospiraceae bacterium]|nr:hypothetical protein [Lachnospiraceae bacterium]
MKIVFKSLLLLMFAILLTGCGKKDSAAPFKWFDVYLGDTLENGKIKLSEFPDVVFQSDLNYDLEYNDYPDVSLYAKVSDTRELLYGHLRIRSIYFCDLNGDGKREICSTVSGIFSEIVYDFCIIYDYANKKHVVFRDDNDYYRLSLKDNSLVINQYDFRTSKIIKSGSFIYKDNDYQIVWNTDDTLISKDTIDKTFTSKVSFADYYEGGLLYKNALNRDIIQNSHSSRYISHTPIYKFDNLEELEAFKENCQANLILNEGYNEIPSFQSVTENYDEGFFKDHSILLAYVPVDNSTIRCEVTNLYIDETNCKMFVSLLNTRDASDQCVSGWLAVAEISKASTQNCTSFDAIIIKYPDLANK